MSYNILIVSAVRNVQTEKRLHSIFMQIHPFISIYNIVLELSGVILKVIR